MSPVIACVVPTASLGAGRRVSFSCTVKAACDSFETTKWIGAAASACALPTVPAAGEAAAPALGAAVPAGFAEPTTALAAPPGAEAVRVAGAAGSLLRVK